MRYLGGKVTLRKWLVPVMSVPSDAVYVEPFLGGAAMMVGHSHVKTRIGSDAHPHLIAMHKYIQSGGTFDSNVSKEEYLRAKTHPEEFDSARLGYIGFGSSMHGDWFRGYIGIPGDKKQNNKRTLAQSTLSCLMRDKPKMQDVELICSDYRNLQIPDGSYVYCDPPYANTLGYSTGSFDTQEFWVWASALSKRATVYVSELEAPSNWKTIWSQDCSAMSSGSAKRRRVEKLFMAV